MDPRGSYVSKILHVKTKESGPVGGRAPGAPPLDPPMNLALDIHVSANIRHDYCLFTKKCTQFYDVILQSFEEISILSAVGRVWVYFLRNVNIYFLN